MTPKKNIVRKPIYTFPDGSSLNTSCLGPEFTPRETAFIVWYTAPETEAFLNAGRAAIRAGYKPENAVTQGYLLRQKPRISAKIESRLQPVGDRLHEEIWRIWDISRMRMFFDISDFYRGVPCKRKIRIRGEVFEYDSTDIEAIPLNAIPEYKRLCIDGIELEGPECKAFYKLPNRDNAFRQFLQCSMLLAPDIFQEDQMLRALASVYKVKPARKGLKGMASYLRGEG